MAVVFNVTSPAACQRGEECGVARPTPAVEFSACGRGNADGVISTFHWCHSEPVTTPALSSSDGALVNKHDVAGKNV